MSPQVGDNGEVAATALSLTSVWLLASVTVHMSLERAGASEALVADLALVLLLCGRRDLGVELAHHGLGRWKRVVADKARWPW